MPSPTDMLHLMSSRPKIWKVMFGNQLVKPVIASDIIVRAAPFRILNALKSVLVDHALAPPPGGTLQHALDKRRHTCESMLSQSRQNLARVP